MDCQGRSGGLAVFWSDTVQCVVTGYSQNFVDVEVMEERGGRWRLTLFYGFPETTRSRDCWTLLRSLASRSTLPWCVLGDINNLLHTSDKKGRFPPPSWLLNGFQNAIRDCNLIDMPLEGYLLLGARVWAHPVPLRSVLIVLWPLVSGSKFIRRLDCRTLWRLHLITHL